MSWTEDNPIAFRGLESSRQLIIAIAAQISDYELSSEDVVAFSIKVGQILSAMTALAHAMDSTTLGDELEQLFTEE